LAIEVFDNGNSWNRGFLQRKLLAMEALKMEAVEDVSC
jgi:hypothetical protein